jgi:hypothetical protein
MGWLSGSWISWLYSANSWNSLLLSVDTKQARLVESIIRWQTQSYPSKVMEIWTAASCKPCKVRGVVARRDRWLGQRLNAVSLVELSQSVTREPNLREFVVEFPSRLDLLAWRLLWRWVVFSLSLSILGHRHGVRAEIEMVGRWVEKVLEEHRFREGWTGSTQRSCMR